MGADADRDDRITLHETYDYANRRIGAITGEGLWIKSEGELILRP